MAWLDLPPNPFSPQIKLPRISGLVYLWISKCFYFSLKFKRQAAQIESVPSPVTSTVTSVQVHSS